MAHLDLEYDTDAVSLTSTVESNNESLYIIERILSEGMGENDDGDEVKKYLIEWEGYPMAACTWEPEENLRETGILQRWALVKARMGDGLLQYIGKNEAAFNKEFAKAEAATALRKQKRAKKRSNLRKRSRPVVSVDDSDDDIPLMEQLRASRQSAKAAPSESQEIYNDLFLDSQDPNPLGPPSALEQSDFSLFVEQRPEVRRAPLEQSTDDEEESADLLMGELAAKAKSNARQKASSGSGVNKGPNLGNSILSPKIPKSKATVPPVKSALDQSELRAQIQTQPSKPPKALTGRKQATERLSESTAQVSPTKPGKDSAPVTRKACTTQKQSLSTDPAAIRKRGTASISRIKITNEPKTRHRKEWQDSDRPYNTLMMRHRAEIRSRTEGTPDLDALEFVNDKPSSVVKPRVSKPVDNHHGRREVGNCRIQDVDTEDHSRRGLEEGPVPLPDWQTNKVPLVCAQWRLSSNCPYPPEKCNFMHRNKDENGRDFPIAPLNGRIPPKFCNPPLTCRYWLTSRLGCTKSDSECIYAHRNTGWIPKDDKHKTEPLQIDPDDLPVSEGIVRPPRNPRVAGLPDKRKMDFSELTCWYWFNGKCRKTPWTCAFQHFDTGVVADPPRSEVTCRFWLKGTCASTAEQCKFQHHNTGVGPGQLSAQETNTVHRQQGLQQFQEASTPPFRHQANEDANIYDAGSPPALLERSHGPLSASSPLAQIKPLPAPLQVVIPPAVFSCLQLKDNIEQALKICFENLFEWAGDENGKTMMDRRALLLYHPESHAEDLEVITRWLLMHHVEVSSPWFEGCLDHYQQQLGNGGSGIIIAHPDFEYFTELPSFGQLLQKQVRLWSLGVQEGIEYDAAISDSPPALRHDCIEIFPIGGFIYITDDVFEEKPQLALMIIKLFFAKIDRLRQLDGPVSPWHEVANAGLLWRLCVRPELMAYLFQRCEEQERELEAGDPDVMARAELYNLLSDTNYIDQDSPVQPLSVSADHFPVMSERRMFAEEEPVNYFETLAYSREEANLCMIRYYAGLQVEMRRDYRHFFVVHTDPATTCVGQWKEEIKSIADVITPEQCIKELSTTWAEHGKESIFNFCERYMPELQNKESPQMMDSQMSLEDGEIRPTQ